MHGIFDLCRGFAISEHPGVEKPDCRMFIHALEGLGITEESWRDVVMVRNNLGRDIRGPTCWGW